MATNPEGGADEKLSSEAFGVLTALKDQLAEGGYILEVEDEDEVIIDALKWHGKHLSALSINQEQPDPFKLICWVGGCIMERLETTPEMSQQKMVIAALIEMLELSLFMETDGYGQVSEADKDLATRLIVSELTGTPENGIGYNGLFMAFHAARSAYKVMKATGKLK